MTATLDADAFLLLTLSNCSLVANGTHHSGPLALECVTIQVPGATSGGEDRQLFLVFRVNEAEFPIDPTRVIFGPDFSESGSRKYTFLATEADPVQLVLTIALPNYPDSRFLEDIEIFEGILAQYADLQGVVELDAPVATTQNIYDKADSEELRGHLVLVNQDNGQVVGEFDRKFSVQEDPTLSKKGHENDPVIIEIPESTTDEYDDANAMAVFARAIPPDQQDWITKSATIIRLVGRPIS
jgi:spartin